MAILVTIAFFVFLNILPLVLIIMGVILVKDKTHIANISSKKIHVAGIVLIILGLAKIIYGFITGYGLQ
jgi:hypothetical protein